MAIFHVRRRVQKKPLERRSCSSCGYVRLWLTALLGTVIGSALAISCSASDRSTEAHFPKPQGAQLKPIPQPVPVPKPCNSEHIRITEAFRLALNHTVQNHIIPVTQTDVEGCHWQVVKNCVVRGRYAYVQGSQLREGLNPPSGLTAVIPRAEEGTPPRQTMGVFWAPPKLSTFERRGSACKTATHYVRAMAVGEGPDSSWCPPHYFRPLDTCHSPQAVRVEPFVVRRRKLSSELRIGSQTYIDRAEVSVAAYKKCVDKKVCAKPNVYDPKVHEQFRHCTFGAAGKADHPVNCVSWFDALKYCRSLGKRLPTEKEWFQALGRGAGPYVWGSDWPPPLGAGNLADESARDQFPHWRTLAYYTDGFAETAPVRVYTHDRSARGVWGMAGNVREWVANRYGRFRSVLGASFGEAEPEDLKIKRRLRYRAKTRSAHIGFRCARTAPPKVKP